MQLLSGKFYPHRINGKGFKAGTYKCMDLVYGNKEKNIYYGILIRTIQDMATLKFFTGPCVSVREILSNYDVTEFKDFVANHNIDDEFKLVPTNSLSPERIFVGPRVGLSDKFPDYRMKPYRFAIHLNQIKKQKVFQALDLMSE